MRAVLSTGAGRRWFTWLMQVCGWGECRDPVDNNNRIDPLAVQRNEGARGVAMIVINDAMLHAPEDYGEIFVERARTAARLAKESKQ